ncbi:uncharacterized protein BDR25DRAFT_340594 [Lindgomyces ingoldianus]|uniref:Uncharacterized protein n=1 Tax=Lindgomyces ingoldianus TaxID=673940 RepID=A0ACB6R6M3_9PLEO|nr:uncharacterized protein BDR25DRAFT_340594 [Lindgomyces ingoldianus]KAF2474949.1 hypothetical protein BDR25DRAFT_340594 [Lindgomyces ingoldianus]
MPPNGLYTIPRHHGYGYNVSQSRQTFSTTDFDDDGNDKDDFSTVTNSTKKHSRRKDRNFWKERSEKKKHKSEKKYRKREIAVSATGDKSEKGRELIGTSLVDQASPSVAATPTKSDKKTDNISNNLQVSIKKRKRASTVAPETKSHVKGGSTGGFLVGAHMVEDMKKSMNEFGGGLLSVSQPDSSDAPTNRLIMMEALRNHSYMPEETRASPSVGTGKVEVGGLRGKKPKRKSEELTKGKTTGVTLNANGIGGSPNLKIPRKSPIPLLSSSHISSFNIVAKAEKKRNTAHDVSDVLVPETPPTSIGKGVLPNFRKTPVPFPSLLQTGNSAPKKIEDPRLKDKHHSFTLEENTNLSSHTSVKTPKPHKVRRKSEAPFPFTPTTLDRMIKPLSGSEPRPRLHSKQSSRASSAIASLPSSSESSVDLPNGYERVGKPYARSGAGIDAFVKPEKRRRKARESHEEAPFNVFAQKFAEVQIAVNFSEEQEYLHDYMAWHQANIADVPLPCLGTASGCTPKKEEIVRIGKEKNLNVLALLEKDHEENSLGEATKRVRQAEGFLKTTILAKVPVPVGRIEGVWALYCPQYAEHHFDRYGYGMRTFHISTIAGFKNQNVFTARLSIPPRPTSFSLLSFSPPPHASFRTMTIRTAAEEYKMELTFLGNGYLQLRVDLNLLLRGKPTEMVGGKKVWMEFMGVHEKALQWAEKRDELEEAGRKYFAKYGGVDDD